MVGFKNHPIRGFIQGIGDLGQIPILRHMEQRQLICAQFRRSWNGDFYFPTGLDLRIVGEQADVVGHPFIRSVRQRLVDNREILAVGDFFSSEHGIGRNDPFGGFQTDSGSFAVNDVPSEAVTVTS